MELFADLGAAFDNGAALSTLKGRAIGSQFGTVREVDDPEGKRRIRVELENKPGLLTDWLRQQPTMPFFDPPVPPVGSQVAVIFNNGDPHDGFYQGCQLNANNPPLDSKDPLRDSVWVVPADRADTVGEDYRLQVEGETVLNCEGSTLVEAAKRLTLKVGRTSIVLTPLTIEITVNGVRLATLTEVAGALMGSFDFQGSRLAWNGERVAVVGGSDTDGDTTTR